MAEGASDEAGLLPKGMGQVGREERGFCLSCGWRDGGPLPCCPFLARHLIYTSPIKPRETGTRWAHRHCQLSLPLII